VRSGLSQAQREPRTGQQDDAIGKWRMAAQWRSWRTPRLPNGVAHMNSTDIASRDYDFDGIAGSGPSLVVVEAPAVVVVMVVKEELQQQRDFHVGTGGWRDGQ
jgi:hypothetical protein